MVGDPATFGILTVSDRAYSGEYEDEGGPSILGFFEDAVQSEWNHHYKVVPDEKAVVPDKKAIVSDPTPNMENYTNL